MFTANTELNISELDYDKLKQSFKTYIQEKGTFQDYDFEGSTLNYILDILNYNTYQNSFYTNMAVNENFLDTAQLRANVVSSAKRLGYIPTCAKSSVATLTVRFAPNDLPASLTIPKFAKFQSKNGDVVYNFHTLSPYNFYSSSLYTNTIKVYEGDYVKQTFVYSGVNRFKLFNDNIYDESITVKVRNSEQTTDYATYTKSDNITEVKSDSLIYFFEETTDDKYEIYFGDGVLGKKLTNGNVIEVEYLKSNAENANGCRVFMGVGNIAYNTVVPTSTYTVSSITNVVKASGGVSKEDIESIRFNAPRFYNVQNRLVTAEDYKNFVTGNYSFVSSIVVWGGESHTPSIPGRVIMSIKPTDGYVLSEDKKNSMISDMKNKNVLSIEPIIIDPTFIFINPEIKVNYFSNKTTLSTEEIYEKIANKIQDFETTNLGIFGNRFVYSKFIKQVDSADKSIEGNEVNITLEKRFTPVIGSYNTYNLYFNVPIYNPYIGYKGAISSSSFKIVDSNETLYMEDDGDGAIKFYYYTGQTKFYLTKNYGTVNYSTGLITLTSIQFSDIQAGTEVKIFVEPESNNVDSPNNQIILLASPTVTLYDKTFSQVTYIKDVTVQGDVTPISSNGTTSLITL